MKDLVYQVSNFWYSKCFAILHEYILVTNFVFLCYMSGNEGVRWESEPRATQQNLDG